MLEHRIAKVLVALVFCLILVGGVVHNTGSSLACPDWPLCYGSLMPEMKGSVAIEHSHRLFATAVGCLTIALAIVLWKKREDRCLKKMGLLAVGLVIFQGVLGGITVLYRLPTAISTAHLATSMLFFSLILWIVWETAPPKLVSDKKLSQGSVRWIWIVTAMVYLQMLLGALVRHTGAGLICPEIPFCSGEVWPSDLHPMFRLHMAHRLLGVVVAFLIASLPFVVWKKGTPLVWFLSLAAIVVVIFQILLGVDTILTQKAVITVTAHLGGAALLLALMVSLAYNAKQTQQIQ